ncbi:hypothetical protein C9J85_05090 [Haloferax sp. wsp5]|nr:hypothetical protein C9J85_05090 [Haloferax sp. wsp5]
MPLGDAAEFDRLSGWYHGFLPARVRPGYRLTSDLQYEGSRTMSHRRNDSVGRFGNRRRPPRLRP